MSSLSKTQSRHFVEKQEDLFWTVRPIRQSLVFPFCSVCQQVQAKIQPFLCRHQVICIQCLEGYTKYSIEKLQMPKCQIMTCGEPLNHQNKAIINQFSKELAIELQVFLIKFQAQQSQSIRILKNCQRPDCKGVFDDQNMTCCLCKTKYCSRCKRIDHQGSCLASTIYPENIVVKKCFFCNTNLYKEGGCSKIQCGSCRKQICYTCMNEWSFSHHFCDSGQIFSLPFNFFRQCLGCQNVQRTSFIFQQ